MTFKKILGCPKTTQLLLFPSSWKEKLQKIVVNNTGIDDI